MTEQTIRMLIYAAERARKYFENEVSGRGTLNGPHDDITIGRDLTVALQAVREESIPITPQELEARR